MKHTILIVDDDKLVLNTMQQQFASWDFEVFATQVPSEAKAVLEKVTPGVILLDLLLTTEDGSQEILDYLKSQPRLQNVPVIVITNLDKPELKEMLMAQGVKEYITKGSMSLDDLRSKVMSYLEPTK